ncbi:MAG: alpha/beta hydrolase domain-containing protein [Bryobacteraceae bacterium]
MRLRHVFIAIFTAMIAAAPSFGEVTKIEIASRTDVQAGQAFGSTGAYEKLVGKVYFSIDPKNPHNFAIVDGDKAPRNAKGRVEFGADVYILAPKDRAKGNGVLLLDVVNRGRKNVLQNLQLGGGSRTNDDDYGDGFLLRQGYTLAWVGWQFDVPRGGGLLGIDRVIPVDAKGKPMTWRISVALLPNDSGEHYVLDDIGHYGSDAYPPIDPNSPMNKLTVEKNYLQGETEIPRDQWQFGKMVDGKIVPATNSVVLKGGFKAGQHYTLSYDAHSVVAGVGMAAIRDLATYIKNDSSAPVSTKYAYGWGLSQTGRVLRDFTYDGFNADERGRKVFDGIIDHLAGAARGPFNMRQAQPNGLFYYTVSRFPFLDMTTKDPATGKSDGVLAKMTPETMPKIFHTNSSSEYWGGGRAASLIHTTLDGKKDAQIPANVRIFHFASTQHGPAAFPPSKGNAQLPANPNNYWYAHRALLVALDKWVREGVEPPASRYPRIDEGTLIPHETLRFPELPGVRSPLTIKGGYRIDLPGPLNSHPLPFLISKVDADGNELGGIRMPELQVPIATYTGWNFRNEAIGEPTEILPVTGIFLPFPVTKAERERAQDPRKSIEERYSGRAAYLKQVEDAARKMLSERLILEEDVPTIVAASARRWDEVTKNSALASK